MREWTEEDSERGIISSCVKDYMNWPQAYGQASGIISEKHFATPSAAKLWCALSEFDSCPDEVILAEKSGLSPGEVMSICNAVETSAGVVHFAESVLGHWSMRQAKNISMEIQDGIASENTPSSVLASAGKRIADALSEQGSSYESVGEDVEEALNHCYAIDEGRVKYLQTGFSDLDKILGGLKPGEMSVISARPSQGKTALALTMSAQVARGGGKVLFSSLEMSRSQLLKRLIHGSNHYRSGDRDKLEGATKDIRHWPLKIDHTPGIGVSAIMAKAMSEKHRWDGLDLLVIDYLGIMGGEGKDIYERISGISRGLQGLAKKLDCPVLVLSQQNRDAEKDKTPQMRHLRDSGSVEQDADQIIMLKRVEEGSFKPVEAVEAWVVKNRNGSTGKVPLTFSRSYARYDSYESEPKSYLT